MKMRSKPLNGDQAKVQKRGEGLNVLFRWLILVIFIAPLFGPVVDTFAQTDSPFGQAQALMASMTPEERVGQLFLVTFHGTDVSDTSQIHDLIMNHHIGGVILTAGNDNFVADPDTVSSAYQLIDKLQNVEWSATITPANGSADQPAYIPLFVGISQEGDGAPRDQILSGLTKLPNEMAIGATWQTDLAKQVGSVMGSELSRLGFNLFLGPSLDVVESPSSSEQTDLGTRVFGGDPFWVGEMGSAYISGLHAGSNGRMMVIAKHFPGRGSSDRLPEAEVATVRKSLEQLKQIELPPFFAVTNSSEPTANVDGLLVSHIRYQGFQGNIRATTRPVSFDTSALSTILALPQFSVWREKGGLIVSDDLGSNAVRDFYSQGGETFSPRVVARDAFLAGNDLLYLGNISSSETDDTYSAILRILDSFAQEYRNDQVFARLVDAAVTRILTKKFSMYDIFTVSNVVPTEGNLANIGASQQITFDVARNSATLINPDPQEINALLPAPPRQAERIVFLTDSKTYRQCSACLTKDTFTADLFQKTVLRLYGPGGTGQVLANRLSSFSLNELGLMLDNTTETNIESALSNASWIVFSLSDVSNGQLNLIRRFFSEKPNLIQNKNIILFSFTAPYYLDATDISKFTAYYSLYSKQPEFVDVAARLLFQQISVAGSSPVSIPSVGYDLITQTSPNPAQVIPLALDPSEPPATEISETVTPEPSPTPLYKIGNTISVHAGPILDHNHHIVPDATVVRFTMSTRDETGNILQQVDSTTVDGVAGASFIIDKPGKVEIRVVSEPAVVSDILQFDATGEGVAITVVVPEPTQTPEIIQPTPTVVVGNDLVSPEGYPRIGVWLVVLLAVFGSALLAFWAISRVISPRWGLRFALSVLVGGLAAYNYLALGFPYALEWLASKSGGAFGVLMFTLGGEVLGILVAWVWERFFSGQESLTS